MAGIGFALRRLTRSEQLSTRLTGLAQAGLASSGPWLFTCAALVVIAMFGRQFASRDALRQFSVLVTYNFSMSLVGTGPIVFVTTRMAGNRLYAGEHHALAPIFLGSLAWVFGLMAIVGGVLYGYVLELSLPERLLSYAGLLLTGGIWLVTPVVSSLHSYRVISVAFLTGMLTACATAVFAAKHWGLAGLLAGLTLGLAIIFFLLASRVMALTATQAEQARSWTADFAGFRRLALIGLILNAGLWADKWVMWFAPGAEQIGPHLYVHASYEGAMFLAYLSTVPGLSWLMIEVETRFFEAYQDFYRRIAGHATLDDIVTHQQRIVRILISGLRRIALLQGVLCACALLLAPAIVAAAGGGAEMVPILRYGFFGALFHILLIAAMTVLAYFDLQPELLRVTSVFLALNVALTALFSSLGAEFHGYGYSLAAMISFMLAYHQLVTRVLRLPYLTFVANNPALQPRKND